ncbi:MAG TPA: plastocyanin/azurin family copper-binding protein [Actinomycetota bacterium]|nr:plastocyanin/azurin family copper-binding protein [Actinomycetota bacterium]
MNRRTRLIIVATTALPVFALGLPALAVTDTTGLAAGSTSRVKAVDGNDFRPATVNIARGDRVKWVNRDNVTHTTTGDRWNETLSPGEVFKKRFRRAGTYRYRCTIHSGMTGTVVVG